MRLIDLDSEYIQETLYRRGFKTRQDIEDWLNFAPTIDAVEVVRCKDCRWRGTEECAMFYRCECGEQHTWETDNDFCSHGERKEGVE